MKIYEEINIPNDGESLPMFPQVCPKCKAKVDKETKADIHYQCKIKYICGGTYTSKPQIQNHTNKFWGKCGRGETK